MEFSKNFELFDNITLLKSNITKLLGKASIKPNFSDWGGDTVWLVESYGDNSVETGKYIILTESEDELLVYERNYNSDTDDVEPTTLLNVKSFSELQDWYHEFLIAKQKQGNSLPSVTDTDDDESADKLFYFSDGEIRVYSDGLREFFNPYGEGVYNIDFKLRLNEVVIEFENGLQDFEHALLKKELTNIKKLTGDLLDSYSYSHVNSTITLEFNNEFPIGKY